MSDHITPLLNILQRHLTESKPKVLTMTCKATHNSRALTSIFVLSLVHSTQLSWPPYLPLTHLAGSHPRASALASPSAGVHTSAFPHICIPSPLHAFVQMSPPWHRLPGLLFNTVPAPSPWTPACLTVFWFFFFSSLCCLLTLYTLFMKSRPHNLSPPRDYLLLEGRGSYLLVYLNCPVT